MNDIEESNIQYVGGFAAALRLLADWIEDDMTPDPDFLRREANRLLVEASQ